MIHSMNSFQFVRCELVMLLPKLLCLVLCVLDGKSQQASYNKNPDGTISKFASIPFGGNEHFTVSAVGSEITRGPSSVGLTFNTPEGHSISFRETRVPGFGDKSTVDCNVNLASGGDHNLNVNAFRTENKPELGNSFRTVGGGLDYTYKEKLGASVMAAHTDHLDRNDYSVHSKINIHQTPSSSLDLKLGADKFNSPYYRSSWQPSVRLEYNIRF